MSAPISANLTRIVYRVTTSARGWRVDQLCDELEIAPRTYRKYRKILQTEIPELLAADGSPRIVQVEDGAYRYLRFAGDEPIGVADTDFLARVGTLHLLREVVNTLDDPALSTSFASMLTEFEARLSDRPFVLSHLLRNVDRMFYAVPFARSSAPQSPEVVETLLRALLFCREVEFVYASASSDAGMRLVRPLSLMTYKDALYLVGAKPGDDAIRTYRVSRIEGVPTLRSRFEYPSARTYSPSEFFEEAFGVFRNDELEPVRVELLFADEKWLKRYVAERRWHESQRVAEWEDGRLRVGMTVPLTNPFVRWVRSFGDAVEVVEPGELKEMVWGR